MIDLIFCLNWRGGVKYDWMFFENMQKYIFAHELKFVKNFRIKQWLSRISINFVIITKLQLTYILSSKIWDDNHKW